MLFKYVHRFSSYGPLIVHCTENPNSRSAAALRVDGEEFLAAACASAMGR